MAVVVITPPSPIVELERAKAHLRVDHDDDNDLIAAYVATVTAALDGPAGYLNRSLGEQLLEYVTDEFGSSLTCGLKLPYGPVIGVESIKYLDPAGVEQTLPAVDYTTLSDDRIVPSLEKAWPATCQFPDAIKIRYRAGYGTAVPAPITTAILLQVGDLYANRETTVTDTVADDISHSAPVRALLKPYRILSI